MHLYQPLIHTNSPEIPLHYGRLTEIIMRENFIIAERYKSRDFVSFHFVFAVNYVRDKNALYGMYDSSLFNQLYSLFVTCWNYNTLGIGLGGKLTMLSTCPSSPHTIHPPHIGSAILGKSVIVLRRFRIHFDNIVSLLHGII